MTPTLEDYARRFQDFVSKARLESALAEVPAPDVERILSLVEEAKSIGQICKATGIKRRHVATLYFGVVRSEHQTETDRRQQSALMQDRIAFAYSRKPPSAAGRTYFGETASIQQRGPDNAPLEVFCRAMDGTLPLIGA